MFCHELAWITPCLPNHYDKDNLHSLHFWDFTFTQHHALPFTMTILGCWHPWSDCAGSSSGQVENCSLRYLGWVENLGAGSLGTLGSQQHCRPSPHCHPNPGSQVGTCRRIFTISGSRHVDGDLHAGFHFHDHLTRASIDQPSATRESYGVQCEDWFYQLIDIPRFRSARRTPPINWGSNP